MPPLFQSVTDLANDFEVVRQRRFGRIIVEQGQFVRIEYRPWPVHVSQLGAWWARRRRGRRSGDSCQLIFDQPSPIPAFLVVRWIGSSPRTRMKSIGVAMRTLDDVARIKGASFAVAHVTLDRITDAVTARFGWERHCSHLSGRHYIKRYDDPARLPATIESSGRLGEQMSLDANAE